MSVYVCKHTHTHTSPTPSLPCLAHITVGIFFFLGGFLLIHVKLELPLEISWGIGIQECYNLGIISEKYLFKKCLRIFSTPSLITPHSCPTHTASSLLSLCLGES